MSSILKWKASLFPKMSVSYCTLFANMGRFSGGTRPWAKGGGGGVGVVLIYLPWRPFSFQSCLLFLPKIRGWVCPPPPRAPPRSTTEIFILVIHFNTKMYFQKISSPFPVKMYLFFPLKSPTEILKLMPQRQCAHIWSFGFLCGFWCFFFWVRK